MDTSLLNRRALFLQEERCGSLRGKWIVSCVRSTHEERGRSCQEGKPGQGLLLQRIALLFLSATQGKRRSTTFIESAPESSALVACCWPEVRLEDQSEWVWRTECWIMMGRACEFPLIAAAHLRRGRTSGSEKQNQG